MANERSLSDLVQNLQNGPHKAVLLIGAGCSESAGIPTGEGFVDAIKEQYPTAYERAAKKTYAHCMDELMEVQRKRLIEGKIQNAKINWGHVAIGQLIDAGHVDRVLTTNFDPLVVRACVATMHRSIAASG